MKKLNHKLAFVLAVVISGCFFSVGCTLLGCYGTMVMVIPSVLVTNYLNRISQ